MNRIIKNIIFWHKHQWLILLCLYHQLRYTLLHLLPVLRTIPLYTFTRINFHVVESIERKEQFMNKASFRSEQRFANTNPQTKATSINNNLVPSLDISLMPLNRISIMFDILWWIVPHRRRYTDTHVHFELCGSKTRPIDEGGQRRTLMLIRWLFFS